MSITAVTAPGLVHLFAFGGHYSAAFTLDRYGHVTETMRQDSANRMQAFIQGMAEKDGGKT